MSELALVYELARNAAADVRGQWANHDGPITFEGLRAIAAALGATVNVTRLPAGKSGMIIKYAGSSPRIYISESDSKERQLFTLAHELGHLWERREVANDDEYSFVSNRDGEINLHEFFANEFAGTLLLPANAVDPDGDISEQAGRFGVSQSAFNERLRRLRVNPE